MIVTFAVEVLDQRDQPVPAVGIILNIGQEGTTNELGYAAFQVPVGLVQYSVHHPAFQDGPAPVIDVRANTQVRYILHDKPARLSIVGTQFVGPDGLPLFLKGMSGFRDYQKHLGGTLNDDVLKESRDLGANYRRVFGMLHYITRFYPQDYAAFYERIPELFDRYARVGLYGKFEVFADAQVVTPVLARQQEHAARVWEQAGAIQNGLWSLGNELPKNGVNPSNFHQPSQILCSQGSALADAPPSQPGWSFHDWHGRRDHPKVTSGTEDAWYVSRGAKWPHTTPGVYPPKPILHDEPIGFGEHEEPNRRSTSKYLARQIAASGRVLCAGVLFHSDYGIHSERLGSNTRICAEEFFKACA